MGGVLEGRENESLGDGVVIDVEVACGIEGRRFGEADGVLVLADFLLEVGDEVN